MVATTIPFRDGALATQDRRMDDDGSGKLAAVNFEAPEQRAALIAALASATGQEAQRLLLAQIVTMLTSEGGYLDGVEGLLGTGNTSLSTIITALAATLNVLPLIKPWTAWAPATANDMRNYAGVEIQVTATATATFTRSANDADYVPISATVAGAASASPLAPGFYSLKGGGYLKWAGTGTILIRGYN